MGTLEEAMAEAVTLSDETLIEPINDILFVNPEERQIEIPETELLLGVYSDRNVERKYFKCPRIIGDNIDLSLCYMFINYVSSSGTIGQQQCNDVKLDETGNYITFSWLLSGNVFDKNIDSKVYFSVQAKMPNGENVFNTRKVSGDVYETVEAGEEITEEYADVILQIISRIDAIEQGGGSADGNTTYTFAISGNVITVTDSDGGEQTITLPSAVTDSHINSLIDAKLGVIENGTY